MKTMLCDDMGLRVQEVSRMEDACSLQFRVFVVGCSSTLTGPSSAIVFAARYRDASVGKICANAIVLFLFAASYVVRTRLHGGPVRVPEHIERIAALRASEWVVWRGRITHSPHPHHRVVLAR